MNEEPGVLILSPSTYSAFSISVLTLLLDEGIPVKGVVIKKLTDRKRLLLELKQSGFSIFKKIYKKLILQRLGVGKALQDGFSLYFKTLENPSSSLIQICKQNSISYKITSDFHAEDSLRFLDEADASLVVFTGGGLIRKPLMSRAGLGVLNCHMGILPEYRGMDCTHWCSLNRDFEKIGFTLHLMDAGVDTGPIYERHYVASENIQSIEDVVSKIEFQMAPATAAAVKRIMSGDTEFEAQRIDEGRQYFTMSKECLAMSKLYFKRFCIEKISEKACNS